jgi:HEPN domain-containing protein
MPNPESQLPAEWFTQGDTDIETAEILLTHNGPLSSIAFHLQQAIEKYLKGYLLATGWELRRIHDLEILLREVIDLDTEFTAFLPACQRITEYYIESRYPIGIANPPHRTTLTTDLDLVRALATSIRKKLKHDHRTKQHK